MKISVIGLGKLGSCHAVVMAYKGFEVIGADINTTYVEQINSGKAPVVEPNLQELLDSSKDRLSATTNTQEAIEKSDVSFLIVPTPSDENGRFSTSYVLKAAKSIGEGLRNNPNYHVVVMTSTLMPGDTESKLIPYLEEVSGKKVGIDFGVCYSPEFIALGSVIKDMLEPDMILIGQSDKRSGDVLQQIYEQSVSNKPYFARMNIINAELTKISVNTYVTTKISYANMITQVCNHLKEADANIVLNAIGQDSRIGVKYLKPGLAFGGPCFPRDNIAFTKLAESLNVDPVLAKATDNMNHLHTEFVAKLVQNNIKRDDTIAMLGLSYKPNTPVIDVSPAIALAKNLLSKNFVIHAYDPMAMENAKQQESKINYVSTMKEAVKEASLVLITTAWEEFKSLSISDLKQDALIIDCWNILSKEEWGDKLIQLGKGL